MTPSEREAAIEQLIAKDALRDLAMRYARAVDRRDIALLRSVYHDDATDEHGTVYAGPASGFIDAFPEVMSVFEVTAHHIGNTSFRVEGERADGELYFVAYHRTLGPDPKHVVVSGRYLDNYERREGQWKIARRYLVWDSIRLSDVAAEEVAQLSALGEIGAQADDYSYRVLPLMARGR